MSLRDNNHIVLYPNDCSLATLYLYFIYHNKLFFALRKNKEGVKIGIFTLFHEILYITTGMLTNQGGVLLFGWWVSHRDDFLTPQSRSIGCFIDLMGCYWTPRTHNHGYPVVPFQRERGKNVKMMTPVPSSLSCHGNNTSAKAGVERRTLDNPYADFRQHCGLCAIWVSFENFIKAVIFKGA